MVQPPRRKPALLGTYKAILDSQTVPYAVKRSSRAKHARLEVRAATGLTVVIPNSYNINDISALRYDKNMVKVAMTTKFLAGADDINIKAAFSNVDKKVPLHFNPASLLMAPKDIKTLIEPLEGSFIERLVTDIARKSLDGTPDQTNEAWIAIVEALRVLRAKKNFAQETINIMVEPNLPGWIAARPIPLAT